VNKTAASATQWAKCILLYVYSRKTAAPSCARTNKNFILLIYRAGIKYFWLLIKNRLRTIEAENPLKVKNSKPHLRIYWFL